MNLQQTQLRLEDIAEADEVPLALIVVCAAIVRLFGLQSEGFHVDETNTLYLVDLYSWPELIYQLPIDQPHYPLYYLFVKAWVSLGGAANESARAISVAFGLGAVIATFYLARELGDSQTGIVAATIAALMPFFVFYSQTLRMYSLLPLLCLVATYYAVRTTRVGSTRAKSRFVISSALLSVTHVFGLFTVGALCLCVLIRTEDFRETLTTSAAAAVSALPSGGVLLSKLFVDGVAGSGQQVHHIASPPGATEILMLFPRLTLNQLWVIPDAHPAISIIIDSLPLAIIAVCIALAARRGGAMAAWVALLTPVAISVAVSYIVKPVVMPRYLIGAAAMIPVLVALGLGKLSHPRRAALLILLCLSLLAPLGVQAMTTQYAEYDQARAYVVGDETVDDAVIVDNTLRYSLAVHYFDDDVAESVAHVNSLDGESPRPAVADASDRDVVYLIFTLSDDQYRQQALSEIRETHEQVDRKHFEGVRVLKFRSSGAAK